MQQIPGKYQLLVNPAVAPETAFEVSFPNSTAGVLQQNAAVIHRFYLIEAKPDGCAVAVFNLFREGDKGLSPLRSTFGGVELQRDLTDETISAFLVEIYSFIKKHGITECKIVNPPDYFFGEKAAIVSKAFLQAGFKLFYCDENYRIVVDQSSFKSKIHLSQQRRLSKCLNEGFTFQEEKGADLTSLHSFIKRSRERKGYPMTMPLDRFVEIIGSDPEHYKVFSVKTPEGIWLAATVTVRFRSDILYNFYPSDNGDYLNFSPSVLLHSGLYSYCLRENIQILDLGIATDAGRRNEGLTVFKQRLGAKMDPKYVFEI